MGLDRYRAKRDFQQTKEPQGQTRANAHGCGYLIQKHDASHLHYDFRLQVGGVLKSWAVPKGPSLSPKDKRLAVETEDHPLEYADFEGTIPEHNYGAGTVMLWDRGDWQPDRDAQEALSKGKLSFELHGERLKGRWSLVKMKGPKSSGREWLLVKEDDDFADPSRDLVAEYSQSIATERTMDRIAQEEPTPSPDSSDTGAPAAGEGSGEQGSMDARLEQLQNREGEQKTARDLRWKPQLSKVPGAKKAAFPGAVEPQLATLYKAVPTDAEWLHEIKYDGYRLLATKQHELKLLTRNGKDWTDKFPDISAALAGLPEAIVDGELVYLDDQGVSNFESLQTVLQTEQTDSLAYFAFDLLYLDGYDLSAVTLIDRKRILANVIEKLNDSKILLSGHIEGEGEDVMTHACQHGLEGIISKDRNSRYENGRTRTWRKIKCIKRQEFVVVGYTEPKGSREGFGALLVGYYDSGKLRYAGKVGTGFNHQKLDQTSRLLKPRTRKTSPLDEASGEKSVTWLTPDLVAEVEFTEWTATHKLRHPSFVQLRSDKSAQDIIREVPRDEKAAKEVPGEISVTDRANKSSSSHRGRSNSSSMSGQGGVKQESGKKKATKQANAKVAGVRLSNPSKLLYEKSRLTKLDVAKYYASIADYMLPYVAHRPLTLVRCPRGHTRSCFFQKHLGDTFNDAVKPIDIEEMGGLSQYAYVEDVAGLVSLVQMGTLEIHTWGSRIDDVEKPDHLVFDLDPDEGIQWSEIIRSSQHLREFLQFLGLRSFVKTSGGKGLHIVVPVDRRHSWDEVKDFAKAVAQTMERENPERYVATMSKQKRKGKIFIDYLRNARGATSICNYSTRSRPFAPISVPLAWDELDHLNAANIYRLGNIHERLKSITKDPWADYSTTRQSLTKNIKSKLKLD